MKIKSVLIFVFFLVFFQTLALNAQAPESKGSQKEWLISDGSIFVEKEYFPEFSWETTPVYFMFGDSNKLLTKSEVEFIANRTDFLTIEKSHGYNVLGAAELGARHEAKAFKDVNPDVKVLFYFNSAWAWPFTSYNKYFTPETINDHPELKEFLVINPETNELNHRRKVFSFDVLNPDFREWWIDKVVQGMEVSGCDGVFIDQMHGFFYLRKDKKEEVHRAQGQLLTELKKAMGPDKILLGNNTTDLIARFAYPAIDANMFEHYSRKLTSKENLLKDWQDMLKIAKDGKMSVFRIGANVDEDFLSAEIAENENLSHDEKMFVLAKDRLEYFLACYLIGAQPYSFFQYGWGWDLSDGSLYDFPEFSKPLGKPLGAYRRSFPDKWEFTRSFEHAEVWVDTENRKAKITWN